MNKILAMLRGKNTSDRYEDVLRLTCLNPAASLVLNQDTQILEVRYFD